MHPGESQGRYERTTGGAIVGDGALREEERMDFAEGCGSHDRSSWTPDDVFELPCLECGEPVEFFKDDQHRRCASCGATTRTRRAQRIPRVTLRTADRLLRER